MGRNGRSKADRIRREEKEEGRTRGGKGTSRKKDAGPSIPFGDDLPGAGMTDRGMKARIQMRGGFAVILLFLGFYSAVAGDERSRGFAPVFIMVALAMILLLYLMPKARAYDEKRIGRGK